MNPKQGNSRGDAACLSDFPAQAAVRRVQEGENELTLSNQNTQPKPVLSVRDGLLHENIVSHREEGGLRDQAAPAFLPAPARLCRQKAFPAEVFASTG